MTAQYPPQYGYAPQPAQYPAPQQPYPQQGYPQQFAQQPIPQQPQVPLAKGSLDDFFSQPTTGGGPGISWSGKPDGYYVDFVVARDVTNGDIQQQTDPISKQPVSWNDGRPKFQMIVPIKVAPTQEFPEGDARLYVRGQLRDELVRAMTEVGAPDGIPKAGDTGRVTLMYRKPSRGGGNPQNIFAVQYQRAQGAASAQPPAQPAPAQQAAPPQPQQPPAQPVAQQPPPAQFTQPQQPAQQQQPSPQPAPQQGPPPPPGMTPEQQAILANVANQPQPQAG